MFLTDALQTFRAALERQLARDPSLRVSEIEASLVEGSTVLIYATIGHDTEVVAFELNPGEPFDRNGIEAAFVVAAVKCRASGYRGPIP